MMLPVFALKEKNSWTKLGSFHDNSLEVVELNFSTQTMWICCTFFQTLKNVKLPLWMFTGTRCKFTDDLFYGNVFLSMFVKQTWQLNHSCPFECSKIWLPRSPQSRVGGVGIRACTYECEMYPPKPSFFPLFHFWVKVSPRQRTFTRVVRSSLTLPFFENGILDRFPSCKEWKKREAASFELNLFVFDFLQSWHVHRCFTWLLALRIRA